MPGQSAVLELEPGLLGVRRARHWVAGQVADEDSERAETVVLLTSELVTNALLYAPGAVRVQVQRSPTGIRVEVCDDSPVPPVPKEYDETALTGRGLDMLETLADAWGVQVQDSGKSVWFEIGVGPPADGAGLPDLPAVADLQGAAPADLGPGGEEKLVAVSILGLPLAEYRQSEQHNDALMREFALISHDPGPHPGVPARLLGLVAEIQTYFAPQVSASRAQIAAATARGDADVDLHLRMLAANRSYVEKLVELLEEADRYCLDGDLLTLAAPPAVRRFRQWYLGEVVGQLAGSSPTPWPYGVD